MNQGQKKIIYLGEVLSYLDNLRCSVPATLIGGMVDRGFSQNDIDLLTRDFSLTSSRVKEALSDLARYLHEVPESQIGRKAVPPKLIIGSPMLWDYVQSEPFYSDESLNTSTRLWLSKLPLKGMHILDVGCGDGYAMKLMQEKGAYPVGISTSSENIKALREEGFEVYLMDQNCLDFEYESFDIVFSHHALEHSIAPALALREAYRVLKRYHSIPSPLRGKGKSEGRCERSEAISGILDLTVGINRTENHLYIFNQEFLEELITHVGFKLLESGTHRFSLFREIHIRANKPE